MCVCEVASAARLSVGEEWLTVKVTASLTYEREKKNSGMPVANACASVRAPRWNHKGIPTIGSKGITSGVLFQKSVGLGECLSGVYGCCLTRVYHP